MDDDTVTGWALAAQRGDRDAAAAFIRATTPPLRRLMTYLADAGEADDLVQETYLRAFAALPRYAQRSPARLWLWSIESRVLMRSWNFPTEPWSTCRCGFAVPGSGRANG